MIHKLANQNKGQIALAYNLVIAKSNHRIYLYRKQQEKNFSPQTLHVPATVPLSRYNRLSVNLLNKGQIRDVKDFLGLQVVIAMDEICLPLTVRPWQSGEKIRPLGSPGKKKIVKILSEISLPSPLRHRVLLVVDGKNRPVWLLGVCISHHMRVHKSSKKIAVAICDNVAYPQA